MLVVFTVPALRLHTPEMGKHRNRMKNKLNNFTVFPFPLVVIHPGIFFLKYIILFHSILCCHTAQCPLFYILSSCSPTTCLPHICDPPCRTWCWYKRSNVPIINLHCHMTVMALQLIWLIHGWAFCFVNPVVHMCAVIGCECGCTKICNCASLHLVTIIAYSLFVIP